MGKKTFVASVGSVKETLTKNGDGDQNIIRTRLIEIHDDQGKLEETVESADNRGDIEEKITGAGYVIESWDGSTARLTSAPRTGGEKAVIGCIWGFIGFLVLIIGSCSISMATGGGDEPDEPDAAIAEVICEQMVEDILKSPSTAEFSNQSASGSGTSWTSSGDVDAENGFGATMRSGYSCTMTYHASDESWTGSAALD